jgi:hypothetical protein
MGTAAAPYDEEDEDEAVYCLGDWGGFKNGTV